MIEEAWEGLIGAAEDLLDPKKLPDEREDEEEKEDRDEEELKLLELRLLLKPPPLLPPRAKTGDAKANSMRTAHSVAIFFILHAPF